MHMVRRKEREREGGKEGGRDGGREGEWHSTNIYRPYTHHSAPGLVSLLKENIRCSFEFYLPCLYAHFTPSDSCLRPFHSPLEA